MASKLTVSTVIASLIATSAVGLVVLTPTAALAYKDKATCEQHEGAGNCDSCPQGAGDPGWHNKKVCGTALAAKGDRLQLSKLKAQVDAEEKAKVARAKQKAR